MENSLSVIIVDDFEMSRMGMRYMLSKLEGINSVREAVDGTTLFNLCKDDEPDIVFMDINLEQESGVELTRQILNKYSDTFVLAVTASKEIQHFSDMIEAGAVGFLLKNITQDDLKLAIDEVLKGNMYFSKEFTDIAKKLVPKQVKKNSIKLSEREHEVLKLICLGHSNQEIADELELSTHTIDAHRKKLLNKLGARNTARMIMIAIKDGLVEMN